MYDIYKVQFGDTIDTIAKKFKTTSAILRELNEGSNFAIGTDIIVPKVNDYFEVYTIQKGDSLYEIARRYNTDYNLLALLNGLNVNDYIYPDMTILVPKKDVKYYITKDNDTLSKVNSLLGSNMRNLLDQNKNIYLEEGQLIVYRD